MTERELGLPIVNRRIAELTAAYDAMVRERDEAQRLWKLYEREAFTYLDRMRDERALAELRLLENRAILERANAAEAEVRRLKSQLESSRRRYDDELGVRRWVGVDPPTGDVVMLNASQWESAQAEVRRLREALECIALVTAYESAGTHALAYAQAALDADVAPAPMPPAP